MREADTWLHVDLLLAGAAQLEDARALKTRLDAEDHAAERLLAPLLTSPLRFRDANLAENPRAQQAGMVRRLCAVAHRMHEEQPQFSLVLARTAYAIAFRLQDSPLMSRRLCMALALREGANAFRYLRPVQGGAQGPERCRNAVRRNAGIRSSRHRDRLVHSCDGVDRAGGGCRPTAAHVHHSSSWDERRQFLTRSTLPLSPSMIRLTEPDDSVCQVDAAAWSARAVAWSARAHSCSAAPPLYSAEANLCSADAGRCGLPSCNWQSGSKIPLSRLNKYLQATNPKARTESHTASSHQMIAQTYQTTAPTYQTTAPTDQTSARVCQTKSPSDQNLVL